jgi:hypothetical protein
VKIYEVRNMIPAEWMNKVKELEPGKSLKIPCSSKDIVDYFYNELMKELKAMFGFDPDQAAKIKIRKEIKRRQSFIIIDKVPGSSIIAIEEDAETKKRVEISNPKRVKLLQREAKRLSLEEADELYNLTEEERRLFHAKS